MKPPRRIAIVALVATAIAAVGAPVAARVHAFDLQRSTMTVRVGKQGTFAFLADNHEIAAPIASGSYDDATKEVELTVEAASLRVLDPSLPQYERDQVQSNTVGSRVVDAARYPSISFRSTKVDDTDANHWKVAGDLTLHGQTHPVTVNVTKESATHFTGSATIRQTQFGISPIRVAGGAVTVKDDVAIEFSIELSP